MATSLSDTSARLASGPMVDTFEPVVDSFAQAAVNAAFQRSGGLCECSRQSHGHLSRCAIPLVYNYRGQELPGGWEAHHIDPFGHSDLKNCEIVCISCYKTIQGR